MSGRTGAGKSTILKLLLGLYEPQSGSIRIGNVFATEVPEEERRSLFGYVEQSFHMVPGTVREQITLYDRRITEKQVQAVAKLTGLEDSIDSLDKGYDTQCTPEIFSQGQWQLLSIARAAWQNRRFFCWMRSRQIWMQRRKKKSCRLCAAYQKTEQLSRFPTELRRRWDGSLQFHNVLTLFAL